MPRLLLHQPHLRFQHLPSLLPFSDGVCLREVGDDTCAEVMAEINEASG